MKDKVELLNEIKHNLAMAERDLDEEDFEEFMEDVYLHMRNNYEFDKEYDDDYEEEL